MSEMSVPVGLVITWLKPLWFVPVYAVTLVIALVIFSTFMRFLSPKIAAVARNTSRTVTSQPIFFILLSLGISLVLIFPFIPYNTLGEDIKILKTQGLTLIKVLSILLAVWSAGSSVSEEIEERTILTLLSKPINRRQLLLGKYFGILLGVSIFMLVLTTVFMPTCAYKVVYDARETCYPEPESIVCLLSMFSILPGILLTYMEVVMISAVAVALSTRLSMIPNLVLCVSVYMLGHLIPLMVKSSIGQFAIVGFVGNLLAAILPVLSHFSIETAVASGEPISLEYLGYSGLYSILYSAVAIIIGLILFEDRDLT